MHSLWLDRLWTGVPVAEELEMVQRNATKAGLCNEAIVPLVRATPIILPSAQHQISLG